MKGEETRKTAAAAAAAPGPRDPSRRPPAAPRGGAGVGGGAVTTLDIARHLGVSPSTVSHVLAGRGDRQRIKPDTQRRVLDAVREMGYRPNASARATRTGRFGSVALVQPVRSVYLPSNLLLGIAEELERADLHLSVAKMGADDWGDESYLPKVMRELTADGLLVNMLLGAPPAFVDVVRDQQIPAVWINARQEADCVHPDDFGAARALTEHLLRLGHTRIDFLSDTDGGPVDGGPAAPAAGAPRPAALLPPHYSVNDRYAGYEGALRAAGIAPRRLTVNRLPENLEKWRGDRRVADVAGALRGPGRPTALIAYSIKFALPAVIAAARAGLSLPSDLSIATFDDDIEQFAGEPITFARTDMRSVGRESVRMLQEKIAHPELALAPRALPVSLIEGGTTGPAPA